METQNTALLESVKRLEQNGRKLRKAELASRHVLHATGFPAFHPQCIHDVDKLYLAGVG